MKPIWIFVKSNGFIECISLTQPEDLEGSIAINSYPSDLFDKPSFYYLYVNNKFVINPNL
jgi:hypothetical protein